MYKLVNKLPNVDFYVNNNRTVFYSFNKTKNEIEQYTKDKWSSMTQEVYDKDNNQIEESLEEIVKSKNDFIEVVEVVSSTLEDSGYYQKQNPDNGFTSKYLNIFLGGKTFVDSQKNNKFKLGKDQTVLDLLKDKCPFTNILLRNLFHNEEDTHLINFLNWLNVVGFKDTHQDQIYMFIGTNEIEQGQGAGKGVLIGYLSKMFSGLVQSVSNSTYSGNFNSRLQNKKVLVFDEVNFKDLKYEILKDITGSSTLNVEYKGKEPIISKNVGSWLMFSNEHDLRDKITSDDRRVHLVRPNPKNGSLLRIITEVLNTDFKNFEKKLHSEINNFIHIISLVPGKVRTPQEITTQAKRDYFHNQSIVSVDDFDKLERMLLSEDFKKKIIDLLEFSILGNKETEWLVERNIEFLKNGFLNYRVFESIHTLIQYEGYISKSRTPKKDWEKFKEEILKNKDYQFRRVSIKENKTHYGMTEKIVIKKNKKGTKIGNLIRTHFARDKIEIPY